MLVFKAPDLDGVLPRGRHGLTAAFLAGAVVVALCGVVLSAWRWQRVLAAFGAEVSVPTLTNIYLASLFLGNVLPSTIGGDVLRVTRASRPSGSAEIAFGSVAVERLSGFVALPLLVLTGFAARPSLLEEDHALVAILIALVTLGLLASIVFLAGHPRIAGRFTEHENWARFIGAVHRGVDGLRREPRRIVDVLVSAIAYQVSVVASVALIVTAMDLDLPIAALFAFIPAVAMIQVLPLSVSGLGVREGMLVLFLVPLGVSRGQAVGLGLLWYASLLVVSALGAPAFVAGNRRASIPGPADLPAPDVPAADLPAK